IFLCGFRILKAPFKISSPCILSTRKFCRVFNLCKDLIIVFIIGFRSYDFTSSFFNGRSDNTFVLSSLLVDGSNFSIFQFLLFRWFFIFLYFLIFYNFRRSKFCNFHFWLGQFWRRRRWWWFIFL